MRCISSNMDYEDWHVSIVATSKISQDKLSALKPLYSEEDALKPNATNTMILASVMSGSIVKNFLIDSNRRVYLANEKVSADNLYYIPIYEAAKNYVDIVLNVVDYYTSECL